MKRAALLATLVIALGAAASIYFFRTAGMQTYDLQDVGAVVTFPDRFEFIQDSGDEVLFRDRATETAVFFAIGAMPEDGFEPEIRRLQAALVSRGDIDRFEQIGAERVEMSVVDGSRYVIHVVAMVGQDCAQRPIVARIGYEYDTGRTPQEMQLSSSTPGFPQVQFRRGC